MLCIILVIGTIITVLIRSPFRRQEAQQDLDILLENKNSLAIICNTNSMVNA